MDTKKPTKKPTKAEAESLLPEAQSNESEPQNQPQADAKAAATEAEPKTASETDIPEAQDDTEAKTQAADTPEADVQDVQDVQETASEEAQQVQEQGDVANTNNGKAIIYAGVVLVRNKTPKPICLSPIQLGIYATITIQSGEVVVLPHKYARSLIMQNCFEQVSGTLVFHETK